MPLKGNLEANVMNIYMYAISIGHSPNVYFEWKSRKPIRPMGPEDTVKPYETEEEKRTN